MASPQIVSDCVKSIKNNSKLKVSIKCRIGIDDMSSLDLDKFVSITSTAGVKKFIIHARKAILGGLSPKQNREIPPLDYQRVEKLTPFFFSYTLSKSSLAVLTKTSAMKLAPNIRVNCVSPGGVEFNQDKEFIQRYSNHAPMKRMMRVSELNGLLSFLCSKESSYMTGENLKIDGGWTSW